MFYSLLGRMTWAVIKWRLRQNGPLYVPPQALAGATVLGIAVGLFAAQRHRSD